MRRHADLPLRRSLALGLAMLAACGSEQQVEPVDERDAPVGELDAALDARAPERDAALPRAAASSGEGDADALPAPTRDAGSDDADQEEDASTSMPSACSQPVGPVPADVRARLDLSDFYQKYLDADGVPILSSAEPADAALASACRLVTGMLQKRADVRQALIEAKARFAIIGKDEGTADIPEYGYGSRSQEERDQINERARGLGGQVASCGEENMLCLDGDRYRNESICLHELAHTVSTFGVYAADPSFRGRLREAYQSARESGILDRTYRKENEQEYWAEGVQDYFDANDRASPPNGIHNEVDTREELGDFDRTLYDLVEEVFPEELGWEDCHRAR